MAQEIQIYTKCPQCNGTGMFNPGPPTDPPLECTWPGCEGGYIALSKTTFDPGNDDVVDKCEDILDKCDNIIELLKDDKN